MGGKLARVFASPAWQVVDIRRSPVPTLTGQTGRNPGVGATLDIDNVGIASGHEYGACRSAAATHVADNV
jgi:hypothetical protein